MFQLNLPAFGTKFHDGNTRRIINYKLGASDRTDSFHDSVPVRIRQGTGTELLGITLDSIDSIRFTSCSFDISRLKIRQVFCLRTAI